MRNPKDDRESRGTGVRAWLLGFGKEVGTGLKKDAVRSGRTVVFGAPLGATIGGIWGFWNYGPVGGAVGAFLGAILGVFFATFGYRACSLFDLF